MSRTINLIAGLALLVILVIALYGGIGALMGFGYYGENLSSQHPWLIKFWNPLSFLWIAGWLYGISMCVFKFRALMRKITYRALEKWEHPDFLIASGHLILASATIITFMPQPWNDLMYLFLIWSGFFYALGVGEFARTSC